MNIKAKKVINITATIAVLAVAAISVCVLVMALVVKFSGGRDIFGYGFYQIVSGSMEPELKVGDVIIAKKVSVEELETQKNVVFYYNGKVVTHKLIAIEQTALITKGVANESTETIPFKDLIGVQTGRLPKFGYVLDFIRTPYGFVLLVALPLIGVIVYQTVTVKKQLRQYNEIKSDKEDIKTEIETLKKRLETSGENKELGSEETNTSAEQKAEEETSDNSA